MSYTRHIFRILLIALPFLGASAEPLQLELVLQNGRSVPVSALSLEGDKFVVKTAVEGFNAGQALPIATVDHVYGERPPEVNQAIALLLTGKPKEAQALLKPVVEQHRMTAKIPGNFWLGAARAYLVACAVNLDAADTTSIGKEISDATPAQGIDPFVSLGKALLMPVLTTSSEDRAKALSDLIVASMPADLCAYASYFRGNIFKKDKKNAEALEAYLAVPCLYPSGGLILNAAAEMQAAELLNEPKRREEAVALLESALRACKGTVLEEEATKRLTSLKN
jgi:tetratricopeptide (TPR) repeat protein